MKMPADAHELLLNMSDRAHEFLSRTQVCVLATTGPGNSPHAVPMWYRYRGGVITISTWRGSQKCRNVERTGKAMVFASGRMPTAIRPGALISGPMESRRLLMSPLSLMSNSGIGWLRLRRCRTTCLSSCPSTRSTRFPCGASKSATRLSHLDPLISRDLELRFGVVDRSNSSVVAIEPNENTFDIGVLRGCMCEAPDAVPTVSSRKDLHVVLMGTLQDHVPEVALYGVVNSVLRFVDEQEAVPAVCKGQRDTEQTYRPVAQAFQRNRTRLTRKLEVYAPAWPPAAQAVVPDHGDPVDGTAKNQLQTTHGLTFPVRQRNPVPIPYDVGIAGKPRPERPALSRASKNRGRIRGHSPPPKNPDRPNSDNPRSSKAEAPCRP